MESSKITTTSDEENEQQSSNTKTGGCGSQTYICINSPTAKHAFYLGVAGVILEGSFTFLGIFGYFVSFIYHDVKRRRKVQQYNTSHG